ncbi:MAG: hypothetical protein Q8L15_18360 [Methylobacter sp.]|nr:hypothetical protein [Methylobacter sp.]
MAITEQWVKDHPETSRDYTDLVARVRSGEVVEFLMVFNGTFKTGTVNHKRGKFGELFSFNFDGDEFRCAGEKPFLADCLKYGLVFSVQRVFLKDTRRMLEIAKNAAEFKPTFIPLNSLDDVEEMVSLMEGVG